MQQADGPKVLEKFMKDIHLPHHGKSCIRKEEFTDLATLCHVSFEELRTEVGCAALSTNFIDASLSLRMPQSFALL